jgi:hypothetical protein
MNPVRCAGCGFLSLRESESRALVEAEVGVRNDWKQLRVIKAGQGPVYESKPLCFQAVGEFAVAIADAKTPDEIQRVALLDRQCGKAIDWRQGWTPQEHDEMRLEEERRTRDLAWQEERREKDRESQERRDRDQREWQESQTRENRRWQFKLAVLAAAFTLLNGLVMFFVGLFAKPDDRQLNRSSFKLPRTPRPAPSSPSGTAGSPAALPPLSHI